MLRQVSKIAATALVGILSFFAHADAQDRHSVPCADTSITEKFSLYYRFDSIEVDSVYLDNRQQIDHIRHYLSASPRIDSITVYAWASPEGGYKHNLWLSRKRAEAAKRFLLSNSDPRKLNSDKIKISPLAENWTGLREIVEKRYHRHDREKVLSILDAQGIGDETRKWRLQQLDKGYTWRFLLRRYMPELRSATWICVWAEVPPALPVLEEPKDTLVHVTSLKRTYQSYPQEDVRTEMPVVSPLAVPLAAVRTNLLVPALNFGVEVPLGNRYSVSADYYYPWFWPSPKNKNCFELLGWSVEGRYWFGRDRKPQDRLKGHSLGVYVSGGYYDFEKDYRGMQGEFVSPGIDYTYSMAIGRKKKNHLEFTLAVGFIRSWGTTYNVYGDYGALYPDEGTLIWDYFGPTKAAVTFVVPFYSKKEGGR